MNQITVYSCQLKFREHILLQFGTHREVNILTTRSQKNNLKKRNKTTKVNTCQAHLYFNYFSFFFPDDRFES